MFLYNKTDNYITFICAVWNYLTDHISSTVSFIYILEHG